jgi:outer membrane lipoprotein-sorting protein
MGVTLRHPMIRWAVPVAAVAVVAGAALVPRAMAEPTLPPKTAEQLLVDLQTQEVDDLSGTVETRAALGLPALPVDSDFASLASGTHTVRVWQAGDAKSRVSLVDPGAETTMIRNGQDVWQWSSESKTATHAVLSGDHDRQTPSAAPKTPQEAAAEFLAHVEPSTVVTVSRTATVAGRPAYELALDPKSDETLVGRVTIAVDAETSAPLQVEVWAAGAAEPALRMGFTQVSFSTPEDSVFRFTPPPGTTVEEAQPKSGASAPADPRSESAQATTVGEAWETVRITRMPEMPADADPQDESRARHRGNPADWQELRDSLPTVQGPWGTGRVLTSALFTLVITDDDRVAVGMVPTERVVAAIPR